MIAFMLFIIAMVAYMFSVHGNDALVEEDYYEKGVNYDQQYNEEKNVVDDQVQPIIKVDRFKVMIRLTDSATYDLKMMRPSSKNEDIEIKGSTKGESNLIMLDTKNMHTGRWFMDLRWTSKGKIYRLKKDVTL